MKSLKFFLKNNYMDFIIFTLLILTLLISPIIGNIVVWSKISSLLFLRSSIWIVCLCFFPGYYIMKFIKSFKNMDFINILSISFNMSFITIGIVTLIIYFLSGNIYILPYVFILLLIILKTAYFYHNDINNNLLMSENRNSDINENRKKLFFIIVFIITIYLCFSIQYCQKYLIPTDLWTSLNPAIEMLSSSNMYIKHRDFSEYPLLFGVILAGISICSGIPVVNTYVLLYFFSILNIVTFYSLLTNVFKIKNEYKLYLSTYFYNFGGGLAWILQYFVWNSEYPLNTLRKYTNDIFFDMGWWHSMEFSHRTLALTMSYISIILFYKSYESKNNYNNKMMIIMSSLSLVFSYFIHMIEIIISIPAILYIFYLCYKKYDKNNLNFFIFVSILTVILMDVLVSNYFTWLTFMKIKIVIMSINYNIITYFIIIFISILSIFLINKKWLNIRIKDIGDIKISYKNKLIILLMFMIIYLTGSLNPSDPIFYYDSFSPNLFLKRYGIIGYFAIIGIIYSNWNEDSIKLATIIMLVPMLAGLIWWGRKLNAYMFPMISVFASLGFYKIWNKIMKNNNKYYLKYSFKFILIIMLIMTSSTYLFSSLYLRDNNESISDDLVEVLSWINVNTERDDVILIQNHHKLTKSVTKIGNREIQYVDVLNYTYEFEDNEAFNSKMNLYNIKYILEVKNTDLKTNIVIPAIPESLKNRSFKILTINNINLYAYIN